MVNADPGVNQGAILAACSVAGLILIEVSRRKLLALKQLTQRTPANTIAEKSPPYSYGGDPLKSRESVTMLMQVLVSISILGCALYLLVTKGEDQSTKWAAGAVGTVVGYWLKP